MISFHEFVLDYKSNLKNKDFINNILGGEDEILIYILMLFQKDNIMGKIISLKKYKSYIR